MNTYKICVFNENYIVSPLNSFRYKLTNFIVLSISLSERETNLLTNLENHQLFFTNFNATEPYNRKI